MDAAVRRKSRSLPLEAKYAIHASDISLGMLMRVPMNAIDDRTVNFRLISFHYFG